MVEIAATITRWATSARPATSSSDWLAVRSWLRALGCVGMLLTNRSSADGRWPARHSASARRVKWTVKRCKQCGGYFVDRALKKRNSNGNLIRPPSDVSAGLG